MLSLNLAGTVTGASLTLLAKFEGDSLSGSQGDRLAQWDDLSGNGNHLVQSTAGLKPYFQEDQLNGITGVRFKGDSYFSFTTPIATSDVSVYIVYRNIENDTAAMVLLGGVSADNGLSYYVDASGFTHVGSPKVAGFSTGAAISGQTRRTSLWSYGSMRKASAGQVKFRTNGAAGTSTATFSSGNFTTVGARGDAASKLWGIISAIYIYSGSHTDAEADTVEAAIVAKFGNLWDANRLLQARVQDMALADNAAITKITDVSGQGNHFYVPSGFTGPTNKTGIQNGKAAARFTTSTTMGMRPLLYIGQAPFSVYVAYDCRGTGSSARRAINGGPSTGDNNWIIGPYNANHQFYCGSFSSGPAWTQNVFVMAHIIAAALTTQKHYVDGTLRNTINGAQYPGFINLSAAGSFAEGADGDVLEVIVEAVANSSGEETTIKSYFASEYGLTIA